MRKLWTVLISALVVGVSAPPAVGVSASGRSNAAVAKSTCKKGYRLVHGRCKRAPMKTTTLTLSGVQVGGFMAVDAQGNIYADSGTSSLVKFSTSGRVLARWEGLHFDQDRPDSAGGIAIDALGNVYVVDTDANRIVKLSPSLEVLAQWGTYGVAPGQFVAPEGIALDASGNIYVADSGNARIQKLSPEGSVLAVWGKPGEFKFPRGIAVDQQNKVHVVDLGFRRIVTLSPSGQRLAVWDNWVIPNKAFPVDLTVDKAGNIYVADAGNREIVKLSPTGKQLDNWWSDLQKFYPFVGVAINPQGTIYGSECPRVSDGGSLCRTVKLSPKGKILSIWKSGAAPLVPGSKVDIGGYGLHLRCIGQGSPTVLLESGYGDDATEWSYIQPQIALTARVCSYDRASVAHSDARPAAVEGSGLQIAKELHALLQKAGVPGPYVLAGHSFGGIFIRLFSSLYRSEVVGMVLIDSSHENQCVRFNDSTCASPTGSELPDFLPTLEQMRTATGGVVKGSLGTLPLIVLTQNLHPQPCNADCTNFVQVWGDLQRDLAAASSNSVHVMAQRSSHEIPTLQPALVIEAIRQTVDAARSSSHNLPVCGQAFESGGGTCLKE